MKQRLDKEKKTAIFSMQNFDLMRNNARKLQRLLKVLSAKKKNIIKLILKCIYDVVCVCVLWGFFYLEKIIYAYMQRHIFI